MSVYRLLSTALISTSCLLLSTLTGQAQEAVIVAAESTDAQQIDLYEQGVKLLYQGQLEAAIAVLTEAIEASPNRADVYIDRGVAYLKSNQFEMAIADFSVALMLEPNNARALYYRIQAFHYSEQTTAAEADWEQLRELTEPTIETVYFRGQASQLIEDGDDHAPYENYLDLTPQNPQEYFYRAHFFTHVGNTAAAIADYTTAIEQLPYFIEAYIERAELQHSLGKNEAALADLESSLAIAPNYVAADLMALWILAKQGDEQRAQAFFDTIITIHPAKGYELRALWHEAHRDLEGAIRDYSQVLIYAPDDISLLDKRAELYRLLGNYEEAIADYKTVLQIRTEQPDYSTGITIESTYVALIEIYQRIEDWVKAEEIASQLISVNPTYVDGYSARAEFRYVVGNHPGAIADYTYVIGSCKVRFERSENLFLPFKYHRRAQALLALGNYDAALQDIDEAISLRSEAGRSGFESWYRLRAQLHEQLGNTEAASQDRETAEQIGPSPYGGTLYTTFSPAC